MKEVSLECVFARVFMCAVAGYRRGHSSSKVGFSETPDPASLPVEGLDLSTRRVSARASMIDVQ